MIAKDATLLILLKYVEPDYQVPSRKTVTARMDSEYGKMATELTCKLERAENISIKTDGWTALTTESYLTITCHFVAEGKMVSAVLSAVTRACWHANLT